MAWTYAGSNIQKVRSSIADANIADAKFPQRTPLALRPNRPPIAIPQQATVMVLSKNKKHTAKIGYTSGLGKRNRRYRVSPNATATTATRPNKNLLENRHLPSISVILPARQI